MMKILNLTIFIIFFATTLKAEPQVFEVYACNIPCENPERVANAIVNELSPKGNFFLMNLDNSEILHYKIVNFIGPNKTLTSRVEEIQESNSSKKLKHKLLLNYYKTPPFIINLPIIDDKGIYKPVYSYESILNRPQQQDWIALSLEANDHLKEFAKEYIRDLREHVRHINTAKFQVIAVLADGSSAKFNVSGKVSNEAPYVILNIRYSDNSAMPFEDSFGKR